MRITSFDRIEKQFNEIKSVESEGFNMIRPTRRRFNLKILAEAAYAVHRSKYTIENLQYKNAIEETILLAQGEGRIWEKVKGLGGKIKSGLKRGSGKAIRTAVDVGFKISDDGERQLKFLDKHIKSNVIRASSRNILERFWDAFINTLKLLWKHVEQFIMSFFDIGVKAQRVNREIKAVLDKYDDDFRNDTFLVEDFNEEVKGILPRTVIKSFTKRNQFKPYSAILKELSDFIADLLAHFKTIHKQVKKGKLIPQFMLDDFREGTGVAVFEISKDFIEQSKSKLNKIQNDDSYRLEAREDENYNINGEKILLLLGDISKAFDRIVKAPLSSKGGSLLSNLKEIKDMNEKDSIIKYLDDMTNKFKAANPDIADNKEKIQEMLDVAREINSLLIRSHGLAKKTIGIYIKHSVTLMNVVRKHSLSRDGHNMSGPTLSDFVKREWK